jgi:hypothetical protein
VPFPEQSTVDDWRTAWTGKFVRVRADAAPDLARVHGKVGRVVTVSYGGRAVVDFADGPWTDVADFETVLDEVTDAAECAKYDPTANSAQARPPRMG